MWFPPGLNFLSSLSFALLSLNPPIWFSWYGAWRLQPGFSKSLRYIILRRFGLRILDPDVTLGFFYTDDIGHVCFEHFSHESNVPCVMCLVIIAPTVLNLPRPYPQCHLLHLSPRVFFHRERLFLPFQIFDRFKMIINSMVYI